MRLKQSDWERAMSLDIDKELNEIEEEWELVPYDGPPFDRDKPWTLDQCRAKLNEIQTQYQVDPERVEKAWQHCLDHNGKVLVVYFDEKDRTITIVG